MDDRRDAGARRVGRRVDVGDQPHGRRALDRPRKRGEDVPVLRELDLLQPDRAKLLDEEAREVELLRGRRVRGRVERGLRVDDDVPQEPLEHRLAQLRGERARIARVSQAPRAGETARPWS